MKKYRYRFYEQHRTTIITIALVIRAIIFLKAIEKGPIFFSPSMENKRTSVSNNSCKEFCQLVLAEYRIIGGENIKFTFAFYYHLHELERVATITVSIAS